MDLVGNRKNDHLSLTADGDVGFRGTTTHFECVRLLHDALPELAESDVSCELSVFGKVLRAPVMVAAMTGGTDEAEAVNRELAIACEARGLALGLGSQRAMLKRPESARTFQVRAEAPNVLLFGNLGGVQAAQMSTAEVQDLAGLVDADAICVHLNPAMEVVQPEGDRDFRGILDAIVRLHHELPIPVIAKETGCGISRRTGKRLRDAGILHADVSGAGGTSWVGVETRRAEAVGDERGIRLGHAFWDWGVPTAASIALLAPLGFATLIATGGITSGVDVAKAIALGATMGGIARPALQALRRGGSAGLGLFLDGVIAELRIAMLLTGSQNLAELRACDRVISPPLSAYDAHSRV